MTRTILIASILCFASSCSMIRPVTLSYIDAETGIRVTEKVGDGVFAPTIDLGDIKVQKVEHDLGSGTITIDPAK